MGLIIEPNIEIKLRSFVDLIYHTNKKFNLTGFHSKEDIFKNLIISSIDPVFNINVPRGTLFADIGTGSGIPGIVFGIYFRNIKGLLIESNQKKADFVNSVIKELGLKNLEVICDRVENVAKKKGHRELYDWTFSRAFGDLYIALEVGVPLLNLNGIFFVYSNKLDIDLSKVMLDHANALGVTLLNEEEREELKITQPGFVFKKVKSSPLKYPRRFSVIKREVSIIEGKQKEGK